MTIFDDNNRAVDEGFQVFAGPCRLVVSSTRAAQVTIVVIPAFIWSCRERPTTATISRLHLNYSDSNFMHVNKQGL